MDNHDISPIAARINARLKELGKTARGASLEAGLSASAIRNVTEGKSSSPRGKTLAKLADVLEVDIDWLLHGTIKVSIHAPVKGRRSRRVPVAPDSTVSIHAPVKGRPEYSNLKPTI